MPTAAELYALPTTIPLPEPAPPPQVAIDAWFAAALKRGGEKLSARVKDVDFGRFGMAAIVLGIAIVTVSEPAFAQGKNDLAGMGTRIQTGLKTFPQIVGVLAQLFGFFWALMAAMALRKAGAEDDRNPQEAKKALFNLLAGVAAIGLPAAMGLGATTLFGDNPNLIKDDQQMITIR